MRLAVCRYVISTVFMLMPCSDKFKGPEHDFEASLMSTARSSRRRRVEHVVDESTSVAAMPSNAPSFSKHSGNAIRITASENPVIAEKCDYQLQTPRDIYSELEVVRASSEDIAHNPVILDAIRAELRTSDKTKRISRAEKGKIKAFITPRTQTGESAHPKRKRGRPKKSTDVAEISAEDIPPKSRSKSLTTNQTHNSVSADSSPKRKRGRATKRSELNADTNATNSSRLLKKRGRPVKLLTPIEEPPILASKPATKVTKISSTQRAKIAVEESSGKSNPLCLAEAFRNRPDFTTAEQPATSRLAVEVLQNLAKFPHCILLTRVGQFYEVYFFPVLLPWLTMDFAVIF